MKLSSRLSKKQKYITQPGFTIVELLIVIVVIAILAAISIVSYTGIQDRANDSSMRSGAAQIEKSMLLWASSTGKNLLLGGSGSTTAAGPDGCTNGGGSGFFGSSAYPCAVEETLVATKFLTARFASKLPKNTYYGNPSNGDFSAMVYKCGSAEGKYVLFWTLRSPTTKDTDSLANAVSECGYTNIHRDSYGMRAAKVVQL